jgi:hypothetical protein
MLEWHKDMQAQQILDRLTAGQRMSRVARDGTSGRF